MIPIDPTTILLGSAMILLTASTTISLLIHKTPQSSTLLLGTLAVSLFSLLGVVVLDLFGQGALPVVTEQTQLLSAIAATHRRLLIILPILLTGSSLVILGVYRQKISDAHARDYRNAIAFSSGVSLIASVLISIETMV